MDGWDIFGNKKKSINQWVHLGKICLKRNNSNLIQKWGILKNKRISKFRDWKIQKDRNVLVMQG